MNAYVFRECITHMKTVQLLNFGNIPSRWNVLNTSGVNLHKSRVKAVWFDGTYEVYSDVQTTGNTQYTRTLNLTLKQIPQFSLKV